MLYTVKSKSVLQDLKEVLKSRNFNPTLRTETVLEVEVLEEEKEDYALILAFVISYNAFKKIIKDELNRLKVEEGLADRFFYEACHYFQNSKYWIGLSKVWVLDFLDSRTEVNADTFATFNMKGFKQEIKDYVENLLNHKKAHEDMGTTHMEIEPVSMEQLFHVMKDRVVQSGLVFSNFKELHILENGEGFRIEDKIGNVLDEEFFIANVGMMLQIGLDGEEFSQSLHDAMTLVCLCHIFEPEKVIIHQGLSESSEKAVKQNEELMTKHTSKAISFVSCEGCVKCDKD